MQLQLSTCLEYLRFCRRCHPEHDELMSILFKMVSNACEIYIWRAVESPTPRTMRPVIEEFIKMDELAEEYNDITGRHILLWPYFVVAAESTLPRHRAYFARKIEFLYTRTKCENIRKALYQLHTMWNVQSTTRWTSLLGGPNQVLIM